MKTEAQIRSAFVGKVLEMPANKALSDFVSARGLEQVISC